MLFAAPLCFGELVPSKLSCEYTSNPLGIDTVRPRLGWTFEQSKQRGQKQTAYQVLIASSEEALKDGKADLWDSGKVSGDANFGVEYAGTNLTSGMGCWWKVRVWDGKDLPGTYSEAGRFEMGLLQSQDWKDAKWIAWRDEGRWKQEFDARKAKEQEKFPEKPKDPNAVLDPANGWKNHAAYQKQPKPAAEERAPIDWNIFAMQRFHQMNGLPPYDPAPLLRREFEVDKPIARARVYLSTPGYYELYLNGKRIGNQVRDPGWTDAKSRVLYVTHDVTAQLSQGSNAIGVMLGRGFPCLIVTDRPGYWKNSQQPKMKALLSIEYADGTRKDIVSDTGWKAAGGPVILDDPFRGEIVDARKEVPGWDTAGFDAGSWEPAAEVPTPEGAVVAQIMPPIRATEEIRPVSVTNPEPGVYVYDFGKNLAGWVRLKTSGPAGTEVLVRYSYPFPAGQKGSKPLPQPGSFYYSYQQHGFILKGNGTEILEPRFNYAGFRYAVVSGATTPMDADSLTAVHVHTDLPSAGEFECSNELVNRIHRAVRLCFENSAQSLPVTDCPRERKGWLGGNAVFPGETGILNFSAAAFYEKWAHDIFDSAAATSTGLPYLCAPAPHADGGLTFYDLVWQSGAFVVPWNLYLYYGDRRILTTYYDEMKHFVDLLGSKELADKDVPHIVKGRCGDWVSPKEGQPKTAATILHASKEGVNIYETACYYYCVNTFVKVAEALGKTEDAANYRRLASDIQKAFEQKFYDPESGCYRGEVREITEYRQSADAVPLYVGLVPEERQPAIAANLVKDLEHRQDRINTGILGTRALMEVLPAHGQGEMTYRVAAQTEKPSWGYMINSGLTTISEGWDGNGSPDLMAFGSAGAYYYRWLGGIQPDERHPGFKHFFLRPTFVKELDFVRTAYDSTAGRIESRWERKNGELKWDVVVPANTTAEVTIPAEVKVTKESDQAVMSASGVKLLRNENGNSVFEVSSGAYRFEWAEN